MVEMAGTTTWGVAGKKNSQRKVITGGGQMSGEGGQLVETVVCGYGVDTL